MKRSTYIYRGFERFWHWSQALLIFFLALTGFEMHGSFKIFGFENTVKWHNIAAWAFLVLIIFAIFWHFVTGEWKQYIPTTKYVKAQIDYYLTGIFRGASHPTHKTIYNKFNPLQRLIYLGLKLLVIPVQVITGIIYMTYIYPNETLHLEGLSNIAIIHTFGAFLLIAFVIAHVYLTTTGETPLASIKAMLTGWEVIHVDGKEERLKHLHKAVDESVAGYYRLNDKGIFMDVNDAWLKMYNCKDGNKIIGQHFSITRDKKDVAELTELVNDVMKGNSIAGVTARRKNMDGTFGYHILSSNPVFENDKITGVEGFILNFSEKEEASEYLYKVVKNSGAGYYRLDENGIIKDVNEAWLKMYKYDDSGEIMGKHFSITRPVNQVKNLENTFKKVLDGEIIGGEIATRICKDGSEAKHILSANPVLIGNRVVGMEGFILDITSLDISN